jgi:hypothetical protein
LNSFTPISNARTTDAFGAVPLNGAANNFSGMLPVGIGLLSAALAAGPIFPPSAATAGGGCGARPRGAT